MWSAGQCVIGDKSVIGSERFVWPQTRPTHPTSKTRGVSGLVALWRQSLCLLDSITITKHISKQILGEISWSVYVLCLSLPYDWSRNQTFLYGNTYIVSNTTFSIVSYNIRHREQAWSILCNKLTSLQEVVGAWQWFSCTTKKIKQFLLLFTLVHDMCYFDEPPYHNLVLQGFWIILWYLNYMYV